ncbi:MAG: FAD-dependent oxidoreductase [Acidobacteria bacterium]|nr:FAD-dependent oxidoreductase [Acidobacteriota bacterium]
MSYTYDMLVIGGGAAGLTAAGMSAVLGAKTVLIEANLLGGDCTWHGCVPSKSLLKAAKIAHELRHASRYGLTATPNEHDLGRVMARVKAIRQHVYEDADAPPHFEKLGVEVIMGQARFISPHTVEVSNGGSAQHLSAKRFVIATGTAPRRLEIPGSQDVKLLTNETIFDLDQLPKRLLVIGAGPIGVEMAQAFHRLGSDVTVVTSSGRILPRDDAELSTLLLEHLRGEGIRILLNTEIKAFDRGAAISTDGERLSADAVLVAVGRTPNVGSLNLPAAGVQFNNKGVVVDSRCRSSARHVYAAGDVAGRYLFTHMAEHMAKIAVTNALLRFPSSIDERHVPWTTFSDPELAHVGRNEDDLRRDGVRYSVFRFPYSQLDRAITDSETTGLIKVLANRWGRILGVTILGAHAGELIGEYAVAMKNGIRLDKVSSTIHPYPTFGMGNRRAADLFVTTKFTPAMARLIRWVFRLRGENRALPALNQPLAVDATPDRERSTGMNPAEKTIHE